MNDHYYSRTQNADSKPLFWNYTLKNHPFRFKTDNGVFSKKEVDFGSRLLIETFEAPKINGLFLDVGCGYGPIGLAVALSYPNEIVHMVDVNERAISLAKENAKINQVSNVLIYESDQLSNVKEKDFAAVITNPPIRAGKKIVHGIFTQALDHLKPNGELWVVIQKKQGAPSTLNKLSELYGKVEVVVKEKGYFIIKAVKH
ncbi:class I SAM-dependent methyltransferase [Bacillus aquiflavi]|uniref:Class I SAM-dependent methyltransferase n=1 Tax=Bacillus aquiflavi TaxID=2672567 RepID=A0A6B3VZZ6_9BACI|nr:class I SAM-dependent methyltransferase [Bacillus aquiflavi]MBA4537006.1 class I SAM-dependent methyltransferase [Bacillus aquiflavi]NEY81303.1 class I SAM-dependent methyltransferase [Bacillus aquiflavi]UAC48270.1 class I SAM-dependent methyltransferase [Bacillus aquiflavi]